MQLLETILYGICLAFDFQWTENLVIYVVSFTEVFAFTGSEDLTQDYPSPLPLYLLEYVILDSLHREVVSILEGAQNLCLGPADLYSCT